MRCGMERNFVREAFESGFRSRVDLDAVNIRMDYGNRFGVTVGSVKITRTPRPSRSTMISHSGTGLVRENGLAECRAGVQTMVHCGSSNRCDASSRTSRFRSFRSSEGVQRLFDLTGYCGEEVRRSRARGGF